MKKTKKVFRKTFQLFALVLFAAALHSCETEIPPEDLTPPKFSFQVNGQIFDQNTNYNTTTLNLRQDETYTFTYSAGDSGGLAFAAWSRSDHWKAPVRIDSPSEWTHYYGHNNIYGNINWSGDSANPLTGSIVTGSFEAKGSTTFTFSAADFGGLNQIHNRVSKVLNVQVQ